MRFSDKVQGIIDQGVAASRELAAKVAEKARGLAATGALKLEIGDMVSQAARLTAQLGSEVYAVFVGENKATVSRDTPAIRRILREFERLQVLSETRQRELRERRLT
jgi:hypothetical protein